MKKVLIGLGVVAGLAVLGYATVLGKDILCSDN